jgi:hypothetical protein
MYHIQNPPIHFPHDIVCEVFGWLNLGNDLTNLALVQRSWCHPAQRELFRAIVLKCPVRMQLFIDALVRNIGPANPPIRRGHNRLCLERLVRHMYLDVPNNYAQGEFYGNIASILPVLTNLRSLYIAMRRWDNHILDIYLGEYLPEHAPPNLQCLSIQVGNVTI